MNHPLGYTVYVRPCARIVFGSESCLGSMPVRYLRARCVGTNVFTKAPIPNPRSVIQQADTGTLLICAWGLPWRRTNDEPQEFAKRWYINSNLRAQPQHGDGFYQAINISLIRFLFFFPSFRCTTKSKQTLHNNVSAAEQSCRFEPSSALCYSSHKTGVLNSTSDIISSPLPYSLQLVYQNSPTAS